MTPAKPASHALRQKTTVKSRDTRMPTTRAIAGSSTPARIIAPRRVRSRSAHSAIANTTAIRLMASRYVGKPRPATVVAPRKALGVAIRIGSPVQTIRQTSAIMNERPRVTRTCASSAPMRRRGITRSTMPPNAATRSPPTIAAVQKSSPWAINVVERYAPSMKNEPWVRFGIFMSPKISEKPADSRKSNPPSVMLLTASTTHRFMRAAALFRGSALQRREVARVDGLRQEPLLVVRPELADLGIGLDRGVHELVALLLAPPDVEGPDHVAEVIERERPAGRIGERHAAKRPDERLPVVGLATGLLERRLGDQAVDVEAGGVEAGNVAVVLHHAVDESLVGRRIEVARVGRARDHADRLVAERFHQRLVTCRPAAQHRQLEPRVLVLLHELQRIRAGEALHDRVGAADLRQVWRVVGRHQRWPQLLDDPAAGVLEDTLEARHLLVTEREVVRDRDDALELQLFRRVVGQTVHVLRRRGRGAHEIRIGTALGHVLRGGQAEDRHLRLGGVVGDGQELEGREWPEDHVDVVALDQ